MSMSLLVEEFIEQHTKQGSFSISRTYLFEDVQLTEREFHELKRRLSARGYVLGEISPQVGEHEYFCTTYLELNHPKYAAYNAVDLEDMDTESLHQLLTGKIVYLH